MSLIYKIYRHSGNKAEYLAGTSTDIQKRMLLLTSNPPKSTQANSGVRRSHANFVESVNVPIDLCNPGTSDCMAMDAKLELVSSLPVGTPEADVDRLIANLTALCANTALLKSIITDGKIVENDLVITA